MAVGDRGGPLAITDKIGFAGKTNHSLAGACIGRHRVGQWLAAGERRKFSMVEANNRGTPGNQLARKRSACRSTVHENRIEHPGPRVRARSIKSDHNRLAALLVESAEIDQKALCTGDESVEFFR